MAVETLSGPSAAVVGAGVGLAGGLKVQHGYYTFDTTAVEDGDIRKLCKLPGKSMVVGGWLVAENIDSHGTETLDIDIGWADNGDGSATYVDSQSGVTYTNMSAGAAAADGLVNSGVLTADGVTGVVAAGLEYRPFLFTKPIYFSKETQIQAEVNAAAATMGGGTLGVYVLYYMI